MNWTRRDWIALIGVTLLGAVLRLYKLGEVPPGFQFDEAFNAVDAEQVLAGNRPLFLPANGGREVLYTYWQAAIGAVLGIDPFSLRLASAIFGIVAVALSYVFLRRMIRRESFLVALFTSLVFAVTLWPVHFSHYAIRVNMMPALFTLTFGLFWLGGHAPTRNRRLLAYVAAGFMLGLTPWSNPTGRLAPIVLLLYVLWLLLREPAHRRWAWDSLLGGLFITGGIAFLVFLPLGLEFVRHPEWFFGHASEVSIFAERVGGDSPLQILVEHLLQVLGMFSFTGDVDWTHGPEKRPVFDPLLSIPFYIGLALWLWRLRRADDPDFEALSILLIWAGVMLLPSVLSERAPNYSRTLPSLPAVLTASGLGLTWIATLKKPTTWLGPALATLIIAGGTLWTIYDYFVVFAQEEDIYYIYDADKLDALEHLHDLTDGNQVYLSQLWGDGHATVYFLRGQYDINSIETSNALVLPPPGKGLVYAFPSEQHERAGQIADLWPDATLARLDDRYGRHLLSIVQVPAESAAGWPARYTPSVTTEARFVEAPTLLGMSTEADGDIVLYWRGEEVMLRDLTAFIHLIDATGRRVGQIDKQPGSGSYATPWWHIGERVIDVYTPEITDLCAGGETVRAQVGWYQLLADGMRMARSDAPGDTALAGEVTLPHFSYPAERFSMDAAANAELGEVTLFGYTRRGDDLQPGAPLTLDLLWQGAPAQANAPVTVTLEGNGESIVLWNDRLAPEARWGEDEALCRRLRLRVPETVVPGVYGLTVSANGQAAVLEAVTIGESTRRFEAPPFDQAVDATLGEAIALVGYTADPADDGTQLEVELVWQALAAPGASYKVFVHLVDDAGQLVAQSDALPSDGYATNNWIAGEYVVDRQTLALPPGAAGPFRLLAGLYDPVSGARLPAVAGDGAAYTDDAVELGTWAVD
jgi:hypothetical protein